MVSTIPHTTDSKRGNWKPFILNSNSLQLIPVTTDDEPKFTEPGLVKAVDLKGAELPVLISTFYDWKNMTQKEMWMGYMVVQKKFQALYDQRSK